MIRLMLAQPAAKLGTINLVPLAVAGDRHVEQEPSIAATERECATEAHIDAEDSTHGSPASTRGDRESFAAIGGESF
jgi:hypothetical protein